MAGQAATLQIIVKNVPDTPATQQPERAASNTTVRTTDIAFLNVVFIYFPFKLVVTLPFLFGSLLQTHQSPLRHKKT